MNKIAIIIPAYNERKNLKKLVDQINSNLNDIQILIIDDSKVNDSEQTIIDKKNVHFIYRGKKLGRGSAVLFGLKECLKKDYNIFIEMDADFSHDPNELQDKIDFFLNNNLDVLIASRYLKNSKIVNWSLSRRIFSKLSNFLAKKLLRIPVSDYTNGYRLYSREAAQLITRECGKIGDGFIVLSEILLVTSLNKLKIGEISSIFINRIRGESSVNIKLIFLSLFGLLKLFILKIKKL
jgi:dolichol-phosphate mannosyltransferase